MIWTGDHLDAMRRMQAVLADPARATADQRRAGPDGRARALVGGPAATRRRCDEELAFDLS